MSESPAKVRLVRCPKCENLLPEVTDYAVYQCGGCGAVLRARNKHIESGISLEKSGDESDGISNKISKELTNLDFAKRSNKNMNLGPENGLNPNGSSGRNDDPNVDFDDPKTQFGNNKSSSRKSVWTSHPRYGEPGLQEGLPNYHFAPRPDQEGSSNYQFAPQHEYAELAQTTNGLEVEDDRAELLRKLDELKDQIVRSRDKSKEKVPAHHHISTYIEPDPYANMNLNRRSSNQVQVFNVPFRSQNLNRAPIMRYEQNPYNPYFPRQYAGNNMADNRLFHHPSCSCLICYNKQAAAVAVAPPQVPPPIAPLVMQNDPIYHHDYNRQFSSLSLNSRNAEPHTRWSNDLRRPPRAILATGGRRCRPVAGGSPFVSCCKCFELLQIPKKSTKKMRCAACSEIILISIVNKKLVLSVYTETNSEKSKSKTNHKNHQAEFSSEDYDNSCKFDFESMDRGGPGLTSYKSTVSYTSEDVRIRDDESCADVVMNGNKPSPPPSGSPLKDHFDYSTKYNRAGNGNRSGRSEIEKIVNPAGPAGSSMEESEIEISPGDYCVNTGTSQESGDTNRESDQRRNNNGGNESFFAGMIRNSIRGFSRSSQHVDPEKVNVTVNARPIPDRLVKKAEKLAGPIQPGDYWYDPRAGFWGVMGGPCRGIIPPFIEEFNFPMPEKCADGNTNVFVNGRELHQRDLDLLSSRGLPTDSDRSYIIEISGRVLDEDSGQELEYLGKLAPTVESKKHGFGMKPPRATPT